MQVELCIVRLARCFLLFIYLYFFFCYIVRMATAEHVCDSVVSPGTVQ